MKTLKTKLSNPDAIRKAVAKLLDDSAKAAQFNDMVFRSVDLNAKNVGNFNSKDLAVLQVCDLAKMYGIAVECV